MSHLLLHLVFSKIEQLMQSKTKQLMQIEPINIRRSGGSNFEISTNGSLVNPFSFFISSFDPDSDAFRLSARLFLNMTLPFFSYSSRSSSPIFIPTIIWLTDVWVLRSKRERKCNMCTRVLCGLFLFAEIILRVFLPGIILSAYIITWLFWIFVTRIDHGFLLMRRFGIMALVCLLTRGIFLLGISTC